MFFFFSNVVFQKIGPCCMTYMFYIFAMGDCHGPYQESPDYGMEDEGEHNLWEKVVYGMEWIDTDPEEMCMFMCLDIHVAMGEYGNAESYWRSTAGGFWSVPCYKFKSGISWNRYHQIYYGVWYVFDRPFKCTIDGCCMTCMLGHIFFLLYLVHTDSVCTDSVCTEKATLPPLPSFYGHTLQPFHHCKTATKEPRKKYFALFSTSFDFFLVP